MNFLRDDMEWDGPDVLWQPLLHRKLNSRLNIADIPSTVLTAGKQHCPRKCKKSCMSHKNAVYNRVLDVAQAHWRKCETCRSVCFAAELGRLGSVFKTGDLG